MSRESSLKVTLVQRPAGERNRRQENFREVLRAVSAPQLGTKAKLPRGPVSAQPVASLRPVEVLGQARAAMNLEVQRMRQVRGDGHVQTDQRIDSRLLDLIVKELSIEFSQQPERATLPAAAVTELRPTHQDGFTPARAQDAAQTQAQAQAGMRARAAVALVERIETFVKSQRPAIALTVGGGIDARVEVERTGRNEVALKVTGNRGPPAPGDLARIREELQARGLKLSSISVG